MEINWKNYWLKPDALSSRLDFWNGFKKIENNENFIHSCVCKTTFNYPEVNPKSNKRVLLRTFIAPNTPQNYNFLLEFTPDLSYTHTLKGLKILRSKVHKIVTKLPKKRIFFFHLDFFILSWKILHSRREWQTSGMLELGMKNCISIPFPVDWFFGFELILIRSNLHKV